jgi:predicted RND superfamily exporter protein
MPPNTAPPETDSGRHGLDLWRSRPAPWVASAVAAVGLVVVGLFVDVSPRVEGEFFFADDDPQMVASRTVSERFPAGAQAILRVADLSSDRADYRAAIHELTEDLLGAPGVRGGYSVATNDPASPLFGRILSTREDDATNIVLDVDDTDPELLLTGIEEVVARHDTDELGIVVSGVPVIVELIRRSLDRDLAVFSLSAFAVFALLIGLVYRDIAVIVGTLVTCTTSVTATLLIVRLAGVPIGLLTANLVTIVFVLTLSHVVFLTANWSRALGEGLGRRAALGRAFRDTIEPSFWSMATTLLGFLSLLVATARPLRELGVAGAIGTVTAMTVAYLAYPAFLGSWARAGEPSKRVSRPVVLRLPRAIVAVCGVVLLVLAVGVPRVTTDPDLLSYFAPDSEIRTGLSEIDADGGTSTLDVVVRDPDGGRLDQPAAFEAMVDLQASLDSDSAVGVVLSPPVLIAHARTIPLAGFLSVPMLLDLASTPQLNRVALGYLTEDRTEARYSLRMREARAEPRGQVIERVEGHVREAGLEPVAIAGLYDLQAQLGRLIRSSLRIGIGGLLVLFLGVAFVVSRSVGVATRMWLCLIGVPVVILGTFGHAGIAMDIITSPSANIALAIGADAMIHLVVRVRRLAASDVADPWRSAVAQIRGPVLGATGIVCAGFGIFVLSSFPPTRRFGLAVMLGTSAAAVMALVVLPRLAALPSGGWWTRATAD